MNNKAILQTIRDSVIASIANILDKHSSDTMDVTDLGSTPVIWPDSDPEVTFTLDRINSDGGRTLVDSSSSFSNRTDRIEDISTDVLVDILDFLEDNEEMIWLKGNEDEEPKDILVCEICGSEHILTKSWTDPNTDVVNHNMDSDDTDDNWCEECQQHVGFISKKDFEKIMDDWAREKGLAWTEDTTYKQKRNTYNKLKQS